MTNKYLIFYVCLEILIGNASHVYVYDVFYVNTIAVIISYIHCGTNRTCLIDRHVTVNQPTHNCPGGRSRLVYKIISHSCRYPHRSYLI